MEGDEGRDTAVLGLEPFVDALYEEGDPATERAGGQSQQTPLYDSLRLPGDRYIDQTLIAEGGMKEVYLAFDRRASRQVALAKPSKKLGKDYYDSFLREAILTAKLEHPSIINLFGIDVDEDGRPFFTMEFKRGKSLRKMLADFQEGKGPDEWPIKRRMSILLRVCEGLAYAHSRRVLHLDLKPDNIQVGSFAEVQICDWGLGVVMQSGKGSDSEVFLDPDLYGSMQREIKGTKAYMAPELFDPRQPKTPQMDIFALGCLMGDLVRAAGPDSAASQDSEDDPALMAVIDKARAKDPAKRYRTVEEMHRDLERYVEGYSTSVERSTVARELALFYRRNRVASNIAVFSSVLLSIAAVFFVGRLKVSRDEADRARGIAEQARIRAVALRGEEERARIQAVEALEALQAEKERSEEQLNQQARTAWLQAHRVVGLVLNDEAELANLVEAMFVEIDSVTANNPPPDHYVWNQKFWMCFLTQRFARALEIHDSGKRVAPDLLPLARKFAERVGPSGFLSGPDFLELLQDLAGPEFSNRLGMGERMVQYDLRYQRSSETRAGFVRQLLAVANPGWQPRGFHFNASGRILRIEGARLVRLSHSGVKSNPARCLLRFLDPAQLDLSGTGIRDLTVIRDLRLQELDLRATTVKSLEPLANMRSLRTVVVSSWKVTSEYLEGLPPWVEVKVQ